MRAGRLFLAVLTLSCLCACAKTETGAGSSPEKVYITEEAPPVYVELPVQDEKPDKNLVFSGWADAQGDTKPEDAAQDDALARYRDVSQMENVLALPTAYAEKGQTVVLPLSLCGQVELCAFDLRITYDKNRLTYIGCENADDMLMVNGKPDEGVVRINALSVSNLKQAMELCQLQFEVITQQSSRSEIYIQVVEAVRLGEDGQIVICDADAVHGVLHLNEDKEGGQ